MNYFSCFFFIFFFCFFFREEVRGEFQHAYEAYLNYAYPYDELRPLSCDGVDTWGKYSLTLIDSLDTLAIMGNYSEFARVVSLLKEKQNFDADINVSVFETNIRIVGGLLSAHLLSHKAGVDLEPGWPCNGPLLRLAEDVAKRLLPAFDTRTGMPYGTVNLRHGVPPKETTITSVAGAGTYIVEFGTLSRLTGDPVYEEAALNALYALFNHRSVLSLYVAMFLIRKFHFLPFLPLTISVTDRILVCWAITLIFKRAVGQPLRRELGAVWTRTLSTWLKAVFC